MNVTVTRVYMSNFQDISMQWLHFVNEVDKKRNLHGCFDFFLFISAYKIFKKEVLWVQTAPPSYKLFSFSRYLSFCLDSLVMQKNDLIRKMRLISDLMTSHSC